MWFFQYSEVAFYVNILLICTAECTLLSSMFSVDQSGPVDQRPKNLHLIRIFHSLFKSSSYNFSSFSFVYIPLNNKTICRKISVNKIDKHTLEDFFYSFIFLLPLIYLCTVFNNILWRGVKKPQKTFTVSTLEVHSQGKEKKLNFP